MAPKCKDCRYYDPLFENSPVGKCRRNAPRFSADPTDGTVGYWPEIENDDWCGEFERTSDPERSMTR